MGWMMNFFNAEKQKSYFKCALKQFSIVFSKYVSEAELLWKQLNRLTSAL